MPARFKDLTLPDGSTCHVLAPNRFTRMAAGPPPKSLIRVPRGPNPPAEDRDFSPTELEWLVKSQKAQLLHCVSALRKPDGSVCRLTDKHFADAGPGELSIEALDDETLDLLTKTITELDKEVTAAAASFPQNGVAQGTADARCPGPAIRDAAERTA